MQWNCSKIVVLFLLNLTTLVSFSAKIPRPLHPLTRAQQVHSQHQGKFYIQLGSFSKRSNAYNLEKYLKSKTNAPLKTRQGKKYYIVTAGPFNSVREQRRLSQELYTLINKPKITRQKTAVKGSSHSQFLKPEKPINIAPPLLKERDTYFISLGAGAYKSSLPNSMVVNNGGDFGLPYSQDNYSLHSNHSSLITATIGKRWQHDSFWLSSQSLALTYQHLFNRYVDGTVMQFSLPSFTNYNYQWQLASNLLLASLKLNLFQYMRLSPYINGGIGAAMNTASKYSETALSEVTARISPDFRKNTNTQFAFNAGAGIDLDLSRQWSLSIGFTYVDLGKVRSGNGRETWVTETLGFSAWHVNELLISINYQLPI